MEGLLKSLSEQVIVALDALALLVVVVGTVEATIDAARAAFTGQPNHALRAAWLRYGRWLVAALTLQLAADIVETSIRTSWVAIARVGAIALIRTFLNFFLDRDVTEIRRRQLERGSSRGSTSDRYPGGG
jgi:uncharacterized membrane protein